MSDLLVGATLADFDETVPHEKRDDLPRLENRDRPHVYATWILRTPTNSDSSAGSPSSRSISMTS